MQSIIQFRQFGRHARLEFERDECKANVRQNGSESSTSLPEPGSPTSLLEISTPQAEQSDVERYRDIDRAQISTGSETFGSPQVLPVEHAEDEELEEDLLSSPDDSHEAIALLGHRRSAIVVPRQSVRRSSRNQDEKTIVVDFDGESDPLRPHNWSVRSRMAATLNIGLISLTVGYSSSIDTAIAQLAADEFGVSVIAENLATSSFLVGLGIGAFFAGPISEAVGRNPVYITTLFLYTISVMACGLAPNFGSQLFFRFMAAVFATTPLTTAGGSVSDMWTPMQRIFAFPFFALLAFMGPVFGPIAGKFIAGAYPDISWRWAEWTTLILAVTVLTSITLFQPETYPPVLLKWKAHHLRLLTGDARLKADIEVGDISFAKKLRQAMYRPFMITYGEPIIILLALYLTIIFVIQYTFLNGFNFIFTETYNFTPAETSLAFVGILIGDCLAVALTPFIYILAQRSLARMSLEQRRRQQKQRQEEAPIANFEESPEEEEEQPSRSRSHEPRLPPEFRLWYAMLGAPFIPISIFWMGFTARPETSSWIPLAATIPCGYGILTVFISSYTYIIDSYESFSASALVSVTFIRYVISAGMVEAAIPLYTRYGVRWVMGSLGMASAVMVPVPYLFWRFGERIRGWSKYTAS